MIFKIIFFIAIFNFSAIFQSFADQSNKETFLKQMEKSYKREVPKLSGIKLLFLSELDFSDATDKHRIFGLNSNNKLREIPDFAKKPFYETLTLFINHKIDNWNFKKLLDSYNQYTEININFKVEESSAGIKDTDKKIGVKTEIFNFFFSQRELSPDRSLKLSLKLEPKEINSIEKMINPNLSLKQEFSRHLKYEARYSTLNGLKILITRNNLYLWNRPLSLFKEYQDVDKTVNFSATIKINENLELKIKTTNYLNTGKKDIFIVFFIPLKF